MKEILKYIGLTLIFFMVYSCSGGEDILQEGPEEDPFKDYCLVTIEHSGRQDQKGDPPPQQSPGIPGEAAAPGVMLFQPAPPGRDALGQVK